MDDRVVLGADEPLQIRVPLQFSTRKIDGHLADVMDIHKRFDAPDNIIIENLWGKIQYRMKGHTDHPFNPYPVFMKKIKKMNIASGETVDERLYKEAFNSLSAKKPSHIINQLYYYNLADDASYEIHLALKVFLSMTDGNILIANPTPDTIKFISSMNPDNITIAVADDTLAGIFGYEFGSIRFLPYNAIGTRKYDAVLLFVRNEVSSYNWDGFSVLNHVSDAGLAMISAPEAIVKEPLRHLKNSEQEFDGSGPITLKDRLDINSLYVESALLVPECLTQSHPKKKRILVCRKEKSITERSPIQVFKASYEKDTEILTIPQFRAVINEDIFWAPKVSLSNSYDTQFQKAHEMERKKYTKHPLYCFSPEIRFRFQILPGRKSKRVRVSLLSHKTNKPIISDIEKGLSSSTLEQACQKIRNLAFQEDITQAIIFDLFSDTPMDSIKKYTLITLWFIHRSPLQDIPGYNDQFCINTVFSDEMRHLSSIFPYKTFSFEEYVSAYKADNHKIQDEELLWKQIGIILAYLSRKFKIHNPIPSQNKSGKMSPGAQSVRTAITVRSFTKAQAQKIWNYITEKDKDGYLYKRDPIRILVAIRFMTGLPLSEILALNWGNILELKDYGTHGLYITEKIDEKNNRLLYSDYDPDRIRIIPIPNELYRILKNRLAYLKEKYPSAAHDSVPIIIDNEPKSPNRKQFANMSVSAGMKEIQAIKNAVSDGKRVVELESCGIETDYAAYGGDLFNKNHEYYALENGCNPGSLKHMYGFAPESTVEMFYIDYENEAILNQTAETLSRWFCSLIKPEEYEPSSENINVQDCYKDHIRVPQRNTKIRLIIDSADNEDDIFLTVSSAHTVAVNIR